jgi:hypothetical protein
VVELAPEVRERLSDELIDELATCRRADRGGDRRARRPAGGSDPSAGEAMSAELTEHLGYEPHQEPPGGAGNTRNGSTPKTLATEHGPVRIETPRDRNASFEPQIVRKGQSLPGL